MHAAVIEHEEASQRTSPESIYVKTEIQSKSESISNQKGDRSDKYQIIIMGKRSHPSFISISDKKWAGDFNSTGKSLLVSSWAAMFLLHIVPDAVTD